MDFEVKDGRLIFTGLEVGTIEGGSVTFDFDVLRQIVIMSSRFATGRQLENRTLKELVKEVNGYVQTRNETISEKDKEIEKLKMDIHNLGRVVEVYEERCDRQNQEINEWRKQYVETARALEEQQQGA